MKQRTICMRLTACILTAALLHPAAVFSAAAEPAEFEIRGGVLIRYHGHDKTAHVPEGVTEIGEMAFSPYQFYIENKQEAADADEDDGEQSISYQYEFEDGADDFNDSLETVYLPASLKKIDRFAFYGSVCTKVEVSDGLESIGEGAFLYTELAQISIPDTVTQIGDEAFSYCNLKEIVLPDSVTEIGSGIFYGTELESAVLSASLTQIPNDAFADTELQTVTIPDSVNRIGRRAFRNTNLSAVTLPAGLQKIETSTFENAPLKSVSIPSSVTEIGGCAFAGCKMKTIEIPDSVAKIGENAFRSTALESFTIPASMKKIPYGLLENSMLRSLEIPDSVTEIGAKAFAGTRLKTVILPDSVQTIGEAAFQDCLLESVRLPQNLTVIPSHAFCDCPLLSVQIPDTVTEIGDYAFSGTNITSAAIPESVRTIGRYAFSRSALQEISFVWENCDVASSAFQFTPFYHTLEHDGFEVYQGVLIAYRGSKVNVTLPDGITKIGGNAFLDASRMLTVRLPDSLRVIGDQAFRGCRLLRAVQWNSGLEEIGEEAFANCEKLRKAELPDSVRTVGASAFENCAALTDLRLNDGLEHLGPNAVDRCRALKTLRIPESMKEAETIFQEQPESLVLYGEKGTAAEQIAELEDVPLKPLSALPLFDPPRKIGPDLTLDPGRDTWSFTNSGDHFGDRRYLEQDARKLLEQVISKGAGSLDEPFDGSCYGMSLTVVLAKQGLLHPSDLQAGAKTFGELKPTEAVQSVINFYQYLYRAQNQGIDSKNGRTEEQFADMVEMAGNVQYGESPFVVTAALSDGSHAMVGYGLESGSWEWDGRRYDRRILLWDPNAPDKLLDDRCLYFDNETYDYCIPVYGVLNVYGGEQCGRITSASNDPVRLAPAAYPFVHAGDLNCDGSADVTDAVMLARFLAEDRNVRITDRGLRNAELDGISGITPEDLSFLLKRIARIL